MKNIKLILISLLYSILLPFFLCAMQKIETIESDVEGISAPTTLLESQQLFAQDVVRLLAYMHNQGYKFTFGEAMRSLEQAAIYAKQGKGIKNSLHCKRLAIDINLFSPQGNYLSDSADHTIFGEYWEALYPANRWGGRFERVDGNHYERNENNN